MKMLANIFDKKLLINGLMGAVLITSMFSGTAAAVSWDGLVGPGGQGFGDTGDHSRYGLNSRVPQVYQAINRLTGSDYANNLQLGSLYVDDTSWMDLNGLVVVGQSAGRTNTLGSYDLGTNATTPLITGYSGFGWRIPAPATPFDPAAPVVASDYYGATVAGEFGWHLNSSGINYFSDETMNTSGKDHMLAFALGESLSFMTGDGLKVFDNPYLIGWEDQSLGDTDYNDIMFVVNASPVPVPAAVWLFLSGMVGLMGPAGFRRLRG
ncbi:MAG: DUF4114 domain-containing protein [Gammaproteobacteria bacterium]|nr:DUF4114 domain-containing protein [Gammaproteobacteria bacterium]